MNKTALNIIWTYSITNMTFDITTNIIYNITGITYHITNITSNITDMTYNLHNNLAIFEGNSQATQPYISHK